MISKKIFVPKNQILPENKILEVRNLAVYFRNKEGLVRAVRDIDMSVGEGEIVGLVGESGSGKSVTLKALIGFNENDVTEATKIQFKNIDLKKVKKGQWTNIRGTQIGYIPQDPLMSLNPLKQIRHQLFEAYRISKKNQKKWDLFNLKELLENKRISEAAYAKQLNKIKSQFTLDMQTKTMHKKVHEVLEFIGIRNIPHNWKLYPHEFSGGMRQRIVIAMSILAQPKLIIADEPTTALDVTVQAKVIDLIKSMAKKYKIAVIFISHNIGLVANLCEYIYVMYAGKIVEQGKTWELFTNPRHPYTWALISSMPDPNSTDDLTSIPGAPPNMVVPPKGDAFAPRNAYALEIDFQKHPPMFQISKSHKAATWLLHPNAPNVPIPDVVVRKLKNAAVSISLKKGQTDGK